MSDNQPFHVDPSATSAFSALKEELPANNPRFNKENRLKAVVIGGGTGAPMSIRTLLSLGIETSAVVAMADDGGSTGILREEADVTPPGDIRKCIAAFARNPKDPLVRVFKYRIAAARDHALGNLLLAALEDACGSFPDAISICEQLVDAQGHVYPSTLDHVKLVARTKTGDLLDSQELACNSKTPLKSVELQSNDNLSVRAYEPALNAIRDADLIVLGPGSLFTSIIPNLLVPGIIDAIRSSKGCVLFVCSVADIQGETWGLTAREHVEALIDHGMEGLIDYVLVNSDSPLPDDNSLQNSNSVYNNITEDASTLSDEELRFLSYVRPVVVTYDDLLEIQEHGSVVLTKDLVDLVHPTWHDPLALGEAFEQVIQLSKQRKN